MRFQFQIWPPQVGRSMFPVDGEASSAEELAALIAKANSMGKTYRIRVLDGGKDISGSGFPAAPMGRVAL